MKKGDCERKKLGEGGSRVPGLRAGYGQEATSDVLMVGTRFPAPPSRLPLVLPSNRARRQLANPQGSVHGTARCRPNLVWVRGGQRRMPK